MLDRLRQLKAPLRITIIGMGAMGKGLFYQSTVTPGFRCVGVCDLDVARALKFVELLGCQAQIVESVSQANDAARAGSVAVCRDGHILCAMDGVDAMIESTSAIEEAGRFAHDALGHGQHLILMNAEIDLIFGPWLMHEAHKRKLVYASCDGDQHGVIKRLIDEMQLWGFEPVMAGNIKGYLRRSANPTDIKPEADKRKLDYRMCAAYTDGTKLNIEMALVANALDYRTHRPGMNGPRLRHVGEVMASFDLHSIRAQGRPVVDYILGADPGGGVFAVGYCDHPYERDMMQYYKMGDGPFYCFYRPYHLCHIEAMRCVAEAVLDGSSLLEPTHGFRTNVFAYAKRDLRAGEMLDGIGGHCCYGLIENCAADGTSDGLPICLTENVRLTRSLSQGERLAMSDIQTPQGRDDFRMYAGALEVTRRMRETAAGGSRVAAVTQQQAAQ